MFSTKLIQSVSLISHRLRTPLSVIKGAIETILSQELGPLNAEQNDYLNDALKNTQRLIELINSLLEISAIEEGGLRLTPKDIDLGPIVNKVARELLPLTKASNSQIKIEIEESLPQVNADPDKMTEIIINLISNAIKYTLNKGIIKISLKQQNGEIIFACQDNGMGITTEEQTKIFQKYFRGDRVITAETEGSGLGLYIAKEIIDRSGGRIWFNSEPDKGTTFYFALPITTTNKKQL